MSMARYKLDKEVFMCGQWTPFWYANEEWQVTHNFNRQKSIIDVTERTCTCKFWDLIEISYRHTYTL